MPLAANEELPRAELAGKTVIDPMNYAPRADFAIPVLDSDELTSSEVVQRHLVAARVGRWPTCWTTSDLIRWIDSVDLGLPADSWRSEPDSPLYAIPYVGQPPPGLTVRQFVASVQQVSGVPVPAARVSELAAAAVRGPAGFRM